MPLLPWRLLAKARFKTIAGSFRGKKEHKLGITNASAGEALQLYERMREQGATPSSTLLQAVFKACASSRDLEKGISIHGQVLDSGIQLNVSVENSLLDMFSKCGSMEHARRVFDAMQRHTEVSWNSIILGYAQNSQGDEALELFSRMQEEGFVPGPRTYVAALKACTSLALTEEATLVQGKPVKLASLEKGVLIHSQLTSQGHESNLFVASTLVDMYRKCGSLTETREVFDRMSRHDLVAWNSIITAYAQFEDFYETFKLFTRMQDEGFQPDGRTYVAVLGACSTQAGKEEESFLKQPWLEKGREIHSQLRSSGLDLDIYVANTLVDMYFKCGSVVEARRVFDEMQRRDVVSWNSIILGYAQSGDGESALQLFTRMIDEKLVPDSRTFVSVLIACAALAAREEGRRIKEKLVKPLSLERGTKIHSLISSSSHELNPFVASSLVEMYCKCGSMTNARRVFDRMPKRDIISWTSVINGYAQSGEGNLALEFFSRMQDEGCVLDSRAFLAALNACTTLAMKEQGEKSGDVLVKFQSLQQGRAIHSQLAKAGHEADLFVANNLLDFYVKCGSMSEAKELFERIQQRDVVSWTTLIWGFAQNAEPELALQLFSRMQGEHHIPITPVVFVAVLKACGSLPDLKAGKKIHSQVSKAGLENHGLVPNSLIGLYSRCGSLREAQRVFDSAASRDLVSWNTLLAGYSNQGDAEQVFKLFRGMQEELLHPDDITFIHVLALCSHAGLVDRGKLCFECMRTRCDITPTLEHYNCLVDLLGRSNRLEEAVEMVKGMPLKPDLAMWMTILSSSRKWGNVETGRIAFEAVLEINDKDAGAYSLMESIYTGAGLREKSLEVQKLRRNARAWKKPGLSWWIDEGGKVHRFVAGDQSHPQIEEITIRLRELTLRMKEEGGYVPDFSNVMRNGADDEKEFALCEHSERLAIACALINSKPGGEVRIAKNLRVCEDCHRATVVISKLERRRIVCRDANRFHVFEDGACSCGGFW